MKSPHPVALVTGGTTGIGFATAQEFLKRGHLVVVTGNNPTTLAAARNRLPSDVVVLQADSSRIASADTVAEELRTRFGKVDAVTFNAGIGRSASGGPSCGRRPYPPTCCCGSTATSCGCQSVTGRTPSSIRVMSPRWPCTC